MLLCCFMESLGPPGTLYQASAQETPLLLRFKRKQRATCVWGLVLRGEVGHSPG